MSESSPMNDSDDQRLSTRCKAAMPGDAAVPPFDALFASAEQRIGKSRQQRIRLAAAAALAAIAVSGFLALNPDNTAPPGEFVPMAELMSRTRWTAPSDVLLPQYRIDLYSELPVIQESTKPTHGALL